MNNRLLILVSLVSIISSCKKEVSNPNINLNYENCKKGNLDECLQVNTTDANAEESYKVACDGRRLYGCVLLGHKYKEKGNQNYIQLYKKACDGGDKYGCEDSCRNGNEADCNKACQSKDLASCKIVCLKNKDNKSCADYESLIKLKCNGITMSIRPDLIIAVCGDIKEKKNTKDEFEASEFDILAYTEEENPKKIYGASALENFLIRVDRKEKKLSLIEEIILKTKLKGNKFKSYRFIEEEISCKNKVCKVEFKRCLLNLPKNLTFDKEVNSWGKNAEHVLASDENNSNILLYSALTGNPTAVKVLLQKDYTSLDGAAAEEFGSAQEFYRRAVDNKCKIN